MKNNLNEEKSTMSKKSSKLIQRKNTNDEESKFNCIQALEHAKSLSTKHNKIIKSVKLSQTQYKNSNNISVTLEPEYKSKLVTPFIILEGEGKIYHNKNDNYNRTEPYFLKIRPISMNPILYQIMECIYSDLNYLDPENTIGEKTFKDCNIYINGNNIMSAEVKYLENGKEVKNSEKLTVAKEIKELIKKDIQLIKAVLVAYSFTDNGNNCKIGFRLKTLIMEKICKTTLIDTNGEVITIVTSCGDEDDEDEDSETCKKIQRMRVDGKKKYNKKVVECEEDDECEEEQSLFSLP
ncbi:SWPV1-104 [Shearwaterpox virus]|uniref:Protein OPG079 n=1 Tax=Shearwaterpox virus TaxID=1974596 RepID=A0A1V0S7U8_CNPV|nr:SWPV1-104 [Shearwaterpox virus]